MGHPFNSGIEALASEIARHLRTRFVSPTALRLPPGPEASAALASDAGQGLPGQFQVDALASAIVDRMQASRPTVHPVLQGVEDVADRVAAAIRRELAGLDLSVLQEERVDVSQIVGEGEEKEAGSKVDPQEASKGAPESEE